MNKDINEFHVGDEVVIYWTDHPRMIATIERLPREGDELWYVRWDGYLLGINTSGRSFSYMARQSIDHVPGGSK